MSDLPRLELQCFGVPDARLDASPAPADVLRRKHLALLVYLALSANRRRTRAHLVGLLWPETGDAQGRHSLNEAIRRLRAPLGRDRLASDGDTIELNGAELEVDALRFDALLERSPTAAVALVRGDFLEGFVVEGAPAFEEWAGAERARYRSRAAAALVAMGNEALTAGREADALDAARRALALEPFAEPAVRLLMRAGALTGDAAGALAAFHDFTALLAQELGEQPSRGLTALAERIREQRWQRAAAPHAAAQSPLVPRGRVHLNAFTLVADAVQRGPRTLLIIGDSGSGKTRLLNECLDRCALEGALVVAATPMASDREAPLSTLRTLLRAGLIGGPGSVGADPRALGALATLGSDASPGVTPRQPADHAELAAGLASLLRALVDEQPVALAIDDAHGADGASIEVLGSAVAQVTAAPLLLVMSAGTTFENASRALLRLHGGLGRDGGVPGQVLRLEPLSQAETRELVEGQSPWCVDEAERDRLARRVHFETRGNPFLVTTMLRALQRAAVLREDMVSWPSPGVTIDAPLPIPAPSLARRTIVVRVMELDEASRQVLRAASIGALAVDADLIAVLTGLARERVEDLLAVLERHQLLAFHGEGYQFAAPLIAQAVREECLSPGERRTLCARAVVALASRADLESRLLRVELLVRIGPAGVAFAEALATARAALAESAPRAARRALAAAAAALEPGDEQGRSALDELRARVPA